jgi:hypothetical protein
VTSEIWIPGNLSAPAWDDSAERAESLAKLGTDAAAKLAFIRARAEGWAIQKNPSIGRFPIDGTAEEAALWLLSFAELREPDVFPPLLETWNDRGWTIDGPGRNGSDRHLPFIRFVWHAEAGNSFEIGWLERHTSHAWRWALTHCFSWVHEYSGGLNCVSFDGQEWKDHDYSMFLAHQFLRFAGVKPWFKLPSDGPSYDIQLSRDQDGWSVGFDPQQRDDESDEDFMVRRDRAVEVLVSGLSGLPKVKSVIDDDRDLIVVEGGSRSFKKELKALIEQVGGPLTGMKIDPNVEENR